MEFKIEINLEKIQKPQNPIQITEEIIQKNENNEISKKAQYQMDEIFLITNIILNFKGILHNQDIPQFIVANNVESIKIHPIENFNKRDEFVNDLYNDFAALFASAKHKEGKFQQPECNDLYISYLNNLKSIYDINKQSIGFPYYQLMLIYLWNIFCRKRDVPKFNKIIQNFQEDVSLELFYFEEPKEQEDLLKVL
jgi:hypothetical protein